jgi:hypothetical protein
MFKLYCKNPKTCVTRVATVFVEIWCWYFEPHLNFSRIACVFNLETPFVLEVFMKKFTRMSLIAVAVLVPVALAAPMFKFSSDPKMNAMMMADTIDLTAYPKLPLVFKALNGARATLVYKGADAGKVYAFYDQAFKSEGWKDAPMGAMAGDTMNKPGDTMTKPADDTMTKPADDTMTKPADTMTKPADTMIKTDTMMSAEGMKMKDGSYQGHYTFKKMNLGVTTLVKEGKTFAYFNVK